MKERFKIKCAVVLILTKMENGKEYVLLLKRQNTGILDGKYDISCCGHLEKGETLKEAIVRETKEEIGIIVSKDNLHYSSTIHCDFEGDEYLLVAFYTNQYEGTPKIMEPDKSSELAWFPIHELPNEIADNRRIMIENYLNQNLYSEFGFKN